jgi:hypothetical protein
MVALVTIISFKADSFLVIGIEIYITIENAIPE